MAILETAVGPVAAAMDSAPGPHPDLLTLPTEQPPEVPEALDFAAPPDEPGLRDRLLSSRPGRAFTALAVTVGLGGGGLALAAPAEAAGHRPIGPLRARNEIVTYFNNLYEGSSTDVYDRVDTVRPHRLGRSGAPCDPKDPSAPEAKKLIDAPAAQVITLCEKANGKYIVQRVPRKQFPLPQERHLTYVPLLNKLGREAARSVGLADTVHGNARYIYDSSSELDITYGRPATPTAGVRQLKQLRFHVRHHHETVRKVWYK